jgi:predicted O-methyltransferase YrrM
MAISQVTPFRQLARLYMAILGTDQSLAKLASRDSATDMRRLEREIAKIGENLDSMIQAQQPKQAQPGTDDGSKAINKPAFPEGHFYSPVVDIEEARRDEAIIWPSDVTGPMAHLMTTPAIAPTVKGIDWNHQSHEDLLRHGFPEMIAGYNYPEHAQANVDGYYEVNGQFDFADARVLFCMLRIIRPRRIIEVGSGYSTLLMADINARYLDGEASIRCIEPYPRPFLSLLDASGEIELIQQRAQEVSGGLFDSLQSGDVLFIDSSHVSKTGSDVNRLLLDVLPSLAPGVYVHIHDIFFPSDYAKNWVLEHGFSWNEQYLLQALLTGSSQFQVVFGSSIARAFHQESIMSFYGRMVHGTSFWMRRN